MKRLNEWHKGIERRAMIKAFFKSTPIVIIMVMVVLLLIYLQLVSIAQMDKEAIEICVSNGNTVEYCKSLIY